MSLILFEGAECGVAAGLASRWTSVGAGVKVATTAPRTGAWHLNASDTSASTAFYKDMGSSEHETFTVGFAYRPSAASSYDYNVVFYGIGGTVDHIRFYVDQVNRQLSFKRAGTTVIAQTATGIGPASWTDTWNYYECKVTCDDTNGYVEARINGVSYLTWTGDTRNGGADAKIDRVYFGGTTGASNTRYYDDIYICNGDGTSPNDFLGDCKVYPLLPNGNGTYSQLTGSDGNSTDNYLLVDETTPSTADYNGHATVGNKDTYALSDLPDTDVTIYGISVLSRAAKNDAGAKKARAVIRTASTDYTGSDMSLGTTYSTFAEQSWFLNPNSGSAWTATQVNALEAGFEVRT